MTPEQNGQPGLNGPARSPVSSEEPCEWRQKTQSPWNMTRLIRGHRPSLDLANFWLAKVKRCRASVVSSKHLIDQTGTEALLGGGVKVHCRKLLLCASEVHPVCGGSSPAVPPVSL
jgi:hypothetical protein